MPNIRNVAQKGRTSAARAKVGVAANMFRPLIDKVWSFATPSSGTME